MKYRHKLVHKRRTRANTPIIVNEQEQKEKEREEATPTITQTQDNSPLIQPKRRSPRLAYALILLQEAVNALIERGFFISKWETKTSNKKIIPCQSLSIVA